MALLFGLVALIAAGMPASMVEASPPPQANAHKYLGTWNYDQPDQTTMRNVAVISCPTGGNGCASSPLPLPLHIPQIGNIVFSAAANGRVVGGTDQGCTWTFTVRSDSLELSEAQSCFNHSQRYGVIVAHANDGCRWTLAVQGNTAELDPATQTCQLATATVTLFFWSAASDGEHQNSVMAGVKDVNGQTSTFYLYIGALTRQ